MPIQRYRSLVGHWVASWFRAPRPTTRDSPLTLTSGQLALTFGGHATVLARYADVALAFDPMLGRWLGGVRRAAEPGLVPGDCSEVRLVLISHLHADHLHLPTLHKLPRAATLVVPAGGAAWVSPLGFARVIELQPGTDCELRGVHIIACATSHGDGELARGLSYIVRGDGPTLYLCGDSGYFSGFADVGERFAPDIACLPIGGFLPASFRDRHMSPLDALFAFEDLRARLLVPIHYGAFALSYERLDEPARWLNELARSRGVLDHVLTLEPGQSRRFERTAPPVGPADGQAQVPAGERSLA
jgi:L-ascorbate metabolism protein UlaG (beta-lactamase superfamily)